MAIGHRAWILILLILITCHEYLLQGIDIDLAIDIDHAVWILIPHSHFLLQLLLCQELWILLEFSI